MNKSKVFNRMFGGNWWYEGQRYNNSFYSAVWQNTAGEFVVRQTQCKDHSHIKTALYFHNFPDGRNEVFELDTETLQKYGYGATK